MESDQTGGVKEVTVRLASKADELAILGGTRRRARGVKRGKESPEEAVSTSPTAATPAVPAAPAVPAVPAVPVPPAVPVVPAVPVAPAAPATAVPSVSPTLVSPPPKVTLFGKKTSALKSAALPPPTQAPKLLAKRITTLKKPKLVVKPAPPTATSASSSSGSSSGETLPEMTPHQKPIASKRRRFTERKISLSVGGSVASTRKHRAKRIRVDAMPIAQVKSLLLRKGVLKPKANGKYPPEPMLRSLLKDYIALQE
jgi:hypothetical protein